MLYNGISVWIERDRQDGTALIRIGKDEPVFEDVDVKYLKPIKKVGPSIASKPKVLTEKEKTETQLLNEFFIEISLTMPYNCKECGKPLYAKNKFAKRCVSAHILPKAIFPSIATNKNNIFFLGTSIIGICHCHDTWDSTADKRSKMKVYQLALERFELLKPFLNDKEIIQAYTYLNLEWK